MGNLRKNSFTSWLKEGIESGERRTIQEWADERGCSYMNVAVTLTFLRSRGSHFHPYPGKITVKGQPKTGIVVDITKKEEYAVACLNAYEDNYSLPFMSGSVAKIDAVVQAQPQLISEVQSYLDRIQMVLISARKTKREALKQPILISGKK